jgi:hypothetical protein
MTFKIMRDLMTSPATDHFAEVVDPADPYGQWRVSWLLGRVLDYGEAITAMMLADTVVHLREAADGADVDRLRALLADLAEELGLTATDATGKASQPFHGRWWQT